jgi:glutathione S-transferase
MAGENKQAAQGFTGRLELAYRLTEERLGNVPYFAGPDFTAADIMMVFPLTTMRTFAGRGLGARLICVPISSASVGVPPTSTR